MIQLNSISQHESMKEGALHFVNFMLSINARAFKNCCDNNSRRVLKRETEANMSNDIHNTII
jgi:hypothetical protein